MARVRYDGIEFELISELTERERFDAERLSRSSIDEIGHYTAGLLLVYFTLRRAGVALEWDAFLDGGGFSVVEQEPGGAPLAEPNVEPEPPDGSSESAGIPASPTPSASNPAT